MTSFANLLVPLGLLWTPVPSGQDPHPWSDPTFDGVVGWSGAAAGRYSGPLLPRDSHAGNRLLAMLAHDAWNQVRIEQRMIIRIAPRPAGRDPYTAPPIRLAEPRLRERKMSRCVPVGSIAGVRIQSVERLLLFMRDRRLVGANLDKSCNAHDFYSGFYVEQTGDGQLCAGRDTIHSRAGATCSISRLRELVADD